MAQSPGYAAARMISQSALKVLEQDPKKFYWEEERFLTGDLLERTGRGKSEYMLMGDITETLLFDQNSFSNNYAITDDAPTGQMLEFVNEYYRLDKENRVDGNISIDRLREIANEAYVTAGFKRDTLKKVMERFELEGLVYFNQLKSGKTLVTGEMYRKAIGIVDKLRSEEFIGPIVTAKTEGDIEVYDQLEIYSSFYIGEVRFVDVKGALDRVIIDHSKGVIYPYDFKTTSDYFVSSFISYRYDMQAAFYTDLLVKWKGEDNNRAADYAIAPFVFIVANTQYSKNELWEVSEADLNVGRFGGINQYGRKVKGYMELLKDYSWYKSNNKWNYLKEVYENNGKRKLNCYN